MSASVRPLSLETRLTAGVNEDLRKASCTPRTNLTPNPLSKVDNARPDGETPALVSETVFRRVEGEGRNVVRVGGVADEASGGMGVKTDHEEERKVVRVPESLKTLVANLVVRGGVHQEDDEKHEVAGNASRLGVVDVEGDLGADLCTECQRAGHDRMRCQSVTYGYAQH